MREQVLIQETQLVVLEIEPLQFLALQLPYFSQLVVREEQVPEFWQRDWREALQEVVLQVNLFDAFEAVNGWRDGLEVAPHQFESREAEAVEEGGWELLQSVATEFERV